MDIRPIHDEQDYGAALARVEALMDAEPGSEAADELDILTTLLEHYEFRAHPIDPPAPISTIQFRLEQQGLTRKDLEPYIGHSDRVAEVLHGKRGLSL